MASCQFSLLCFVSFIGGKSEYQSNGAKLPEDSAHDSVKRRSQEHRFVRIGKKWSETANEKRMPPGALYSKRRTNFVRNGRKHRFVRIGRTN